MFNNILPLDFINFINITIVKHVPKSLKRSSANPTKWSNTLKQFVGNNRWIVLSVFDPFVGLVLKGLTLNLH